MADETVVLGIKIDSTDVEKSGLKLKDLETAAKRAERATDGLSGSYKDLKSSFDPVFAAQQKLDRNITTITNEMKKGELAGDEYADMLAKVQQRYGSAIAEADGTAEALRRTNAAIEQSTQEFTSLKSSLDPLFAATKQYEQSVATLDNALERGVITQEQYAQTLVQVENRYETLTTETKKLTAATKQSEAEISKTASEYERLMMALDPLRAVTNQTKEGVKTLNRAFKEGVIDQKQYDAAMSQLKNRHSSLAERIKGTTTATSEANGEIHRAKQGYIELKRTLDPLFAATNQQSRSIRALKDAFQAGVITLAQYKESLKQVQERTTLLTQQANIAGKSMRRLRGAAGNLGHQVQDIAVQMQMGTDSMIILGQQGSQIAAAFGPTGAIVGAFIAIGAAVGGTLITALTGATDKMDGLKNKTKELKDELESVFQGLKSVQLRELNSKMQEAERRIKAIQDEIKVTPNLELVKRGELNKLQEALMVLQQQREELNQPVFSDDDDIDKKIESVKEYTDALKFSVGMIGKSAIAVELEKAAKMGANAIDLIEIENLLLEAEARKKVIRLREEAIALADKQAIQLGKVVVSIHEEREALKRDSREQFIYNTLKKAGIDSTHVNAAALAKEAGALFDETEALKKQKKATEEAIKSQEAYEKSLEGLIKKADPVAAGMKEIAASYRLLNKALIAGDITGDQFDTVAEYLDELIENLKNKGEDAGEDFSEEFIKGFDEIGSTLGEALATGDWDGVGREIGGKVSSSIGEMVSTGMETALSGLGAFAGPLGSLVGGLAGGLLGGLASEDKFINLADERQEDQGTGDVLGSINEKADSIVTSNEMIASATDTLVNINTSMLRALEGVTESITGFSTEFLKGTFSELMDFDSEELRGRTTILGFDLDIPSGNDLFDDIAQQVFADVGAGRTRVVDKGIELLGGPLGEIIDDTMIGAFVDVQKRRSFGSDEFTSIGVDLGQDLNDDFANVLDGIVTTVTAGAEALGIDQSAIQEAISSTLIEGQKLSLQDMDADEMTAEFQALFSEVFNDLAGNVVPYLDELVQAGEEPAEALTRLATSFELGKEAFNVLGFEVAETMGEVWGPALVAIHPLGDAIARMTVPTELLVQAADDLVQKSGGIEAFTQKMSFFEKNFLTAADQLDLQGARLTDALSGITDTLPTTRQEFANLMAEMEALDEAGRENIATLLDIQGPMLEYINLLDSTKESTEEATDAVEDLGEWFETLADRASGFIQAFAPEVAQFEMLSNDLAESLGEVGITLPNTRNEMWALAGTLDANTESGREAIDTFISVTSMADQYYSHLETIAQRALDAAASAADSALAGVRSSVEAERAGIKEEYDIATSERKEQLKNEIIDIKAAGKSRATAIKSAGADRITAIKDEEKARLNANKIALNAAKDGLKAITKELNGITATLEDMNEKAVSGERRRATALAMLQNALVTGDLTGTGDAAGVASNFTMEDFATGEDYRRQVGVTRSVLDQLEDSGESQKTDAEITIERLTEQTQAIKDEAKRAIDEAKDDTDRAIAANDTNVERSIAAAELRAENELAKMEQEFNEEMARLDLILQNAEDQLNALRGIDTSVQSVENAVSAFGSALNAERQARQALEQQIAESNTEVVEIPSEEPVDTAQSDAMSASMQLLAPAPASEPVVTDPTNPYGLNIDTTGLGGIGVPKADQIATFADGGTHSGGMRIVGEEGPELELTGPSRIINNNDLMSALSGDSVADQISQLRNEMNQVLLAIARSSNKTAKRLDRWEGDGLPNLRDTQDVEVV
jgi:chromosome segregation ATPase